MVDCDQPALVNEQHEHAEANAEGHESQEKKQFALLQLEVDLPDSKQNIPSDFGPKEVRKCQKAQKALSIFGSDAHSQIRTVVVCFSLSI